jgi:type II restriction enzyme
MNLQCMADLAAGYRAGTQRARVVSEAWCVSEVFCPACDSLHLTQSKTNTKAIDFTCSSCDELFQLKSMRKLNPNKIPDAGYEAMIAAIRSDRNPNLFVMQYSSAWLVQNLMIVPKAFFTESVIERRKPLSAQARRAGWIGCNILLGQIPPDGKINIVSCGVPVPPETVRGNFARVRSLSRLPTSLRGWTIDVLNVIRCLGKQRFELAEVYAFDHQLQALHPGNRNVRSKIRQQLQVLRDVGLLEFSRRGEYVLR